MGRKNYNFSVAQLMELDACTRCGECTKWCETAGRSEFSAPSGKLKSFNRLLKRERAPAFISRFLGGKGLSEAELRALSDGVYRCTLCARCAAVCPVRLNLLELWISIRQELVDKGVYPSGLNLAREAVEREYNVLGYPHVERASWVDYMEEPPEDSYQRAKAEVLYFVGCIGSFSPAVQSIPEAFARLLTKQGVDFTILGGEEWCCGFPLLMAGMGEAAGSVIRHNIEKVREVGAKKVVFTCPSCYKTWRKEYSPELKGVEMMHSTQFIARLVEEEKVSFGEMREVVTYHDPCDLGRNSGVFEAPRRIIRAIPGLTFVEVAQNRQHGHCCGGGGDLEISDPELAAKVALGTLSAIKVTGASLLVTACQQCKRTLLSAAKKGDSKLEILDIVELSLRAMRD